MSNDPNDPQQTASAAGSNGAETPRERFQHAVASKQSGGVDAEDELWEGTYSHLGMIGVWISGAVLTVLAVIVGLFAQVPGSGWFWLIVGLAVMWLAMGIWYGYRRWSVHYTLSTQRLVTAAGLLWRRVDRVELIDVDDVTYRQGPIERLFGVGTIMISSSDTTTPKLVLPGIERVREVADLVDDARRTERRTRGLHIESV